MTADWARVALLLGSNLLFPTPLIIPSPAMISMASLAHGTLCISVNIGIVVPLLIQAGLSPRSQNNTLKIPQLVDI